MPFVLTSWLVSQALLVHAKLAMQGQQRSQPVCGVFLGPCAHCAHVSKSTRTGRGGGAKGITWGSTIRGQRELRVTMTPFSTENESAGRPAMDQSRTSLGSARKDAKSKSSDAGRLNAFTCRSQQNSMLFTGYVHQQIVLG